MDIFVVIHTVNQLTVLPSPPKSNLKNVVKKTADVGIGLWKEPPEQHI